jgi:uncharacterized membrane protein YeaQ/YmgE (transglycosylase-associated protein family)
MVGVGWFLTIVIGILAGWIAERVMSRSHGLITNLIVGLIGSVIGKFLIENVFAVSPLGSGFWASLIISTIGAIVLLFIVGLIWRK